MVKSIETKVGIAEKKKFDVPFLAMMFDTMEDSKQITNKFVIIIKTKKALQDDLEEKQLGIAGTSKEKAKHKLNIGEEEMEEPDSFNRWCNSETCRNCLFTNKKMKD